MGVSQSRRRVIAVVTVGTSRLIFTYHIPLSIEVQAAGVTVENARLYIVAFLFKSY